MHPETTDRPTNLGPASISRRGFLASAGAVGCAGLIGSAWAEEAGKTAASGGQRARIIDGHLHIHHLDRSLQDTIRHIEATGCEQAILLPLETGEGGLVLTTDEVLEAHRQYPERVIPFCQCDVRRPDTPQRARRYRELGCRGWGEQKEHVPLNDPHLEGVIALCDELNWPITMHFQDGAKGFNQGLAEHLEGYLKKYRRVRILAHAQTWWAHISTDVPPAEKTLYPTGPVKPGGLADRLLSDYPNLYADLSAGSAHNALTRDPAFTEGFLARHRKQLVFASDCPCWDGHGSHFQGGLCFNVQLQELLRRTIRDEQALEDVFHENLLRALQGA